MKGKYLAAALILAAIIHTGGPYTANSYDTMLIPSIWGNTEITWRVVMCPNTAFSLYSSGKGQWLAQNNSIMKLNVVSVGEDINGTITLGNKTWNANDTDIAWDLALGVSGLTPWHPGLIVEVGLQDWKELNDTAYKSAQRVMGNYLNGTMSSHYLNITANGMDHFCMVFDYQQDNTSFGKPQRTYLAYDYYTGVLVRGTTSFTFGVPYVLSIELSSIYVAASVLPTIAAGLSVGIVVIIALWMIKRR